MTPTNTDDIIQSLDVIDRIAELEQQGTLDKEEEKELNDLLDLDEQGRDVDTDEWESGLTLIRDSYFSTYAEEFAEDIGAIGKSEGVEWPFYCIDWEYAARELKHDYTPLEFDGVTYWTR